MNIMNIDLAIVETIQSLSERLVPLMKVLSDGLGSPLTFLAILIILCWCWNYQRAMKLLLLFASSALLNGFLKFSIRAPRPFMISDRITVYGSGKPSFGMPSGHAQLAASLGTYITKKSQSLWIKLAVIIGVGLIALSRVSLGAHFCSDVLVGTMIGILVTYAECAYGRKVWAWLLRQPLKSSLLYVSFAAITVIVVSYLPAVLYDDLSQEALFSLSTQKSHLLALQDAYIGFNYTLPLGMLIGLLYGMVLLHQKGTLILKATRWKQIVKGILAVLSTGGVVIGIEFFAHFTDHLGVCLGLTICFTAFFGLWVSFFAPLLFVKFGFAELQDAGKMRK